MAVVNEALPVAVVTLCFVSHVTCAALCRGQHALLSTLLNYWLSFIHKFI